MKIKTLVPTSDAGHIPLEGDYCMDFRQAIIKGKYFIIYDGEDFLGISRSLACDLLDWLEYCPYCGKELPDYGDLDKVRYWTA
jgi:hypothetical protein